MTLASSGLLIERIAEALLVHGHELRAMHHARVLLDANARYRIAEIAAEVVEQVERATPSVGFWCPRCGSTHDHDAHPDRCCGELGCNGWVAS